MNKDFNLKCVIDPVVNTCINNRIGGAVALGLNAFVVNPNNPDAYQTIQAAVDAAEAVAAASATLLSQLILVAPGIYTENLTVSEQGITIQGWGKPPADAVAIGIGINLVAIVGDITLNSSLCLQDLTVVGHVVSTALFVSRTFSFTNCLIQPLSGDTSPALNFVLGSSSVILGKQSTVFAGGLATGSCMDILSPNTSSFTDCNLSRGGIQLDGAGSVFVARDCRISALIEVAAGASSISPLSTMTLSHCDIISQNSVTIFSYLAAVATNTRLYMCNITPGGGGVWAVQTGAGVPVISYDIIGSRATAALVPDVATAVGFGFLFSPATVIQAATPPGN